MLVVILGLGHDALDVVNISPTKVNPGKKITINGSAFTAATKVTIGGASATFTVNSGIKITATVPTGAKSGKATVQADADRLDFGPGEIG